MRIYNYDREELSACNRWGIFDSGVGGLSVLKSLTKYRQGKVSLATDMKELIYLADTARFPYGAKETKEILKYTEQIIRWLRAKNVDLIIFGCNTASAVAYEQIRKISDVPVLNLIQPTINYLIQNNLSAVVLATQATVKEKVFSKLISLNESNLWIKEIAAPELVEIVESGQVENTETIDLLELYIQQSIASGVKALVLGCTHFSFLKEKFCQLAQGRLEVIDPAELLVQDLNGQTFGFNEEFFVTGNKENFAQTAEICLGFPLKNLNHLPLERLLSCN